MGITREAVAAALAVTIEELEGMEAGRARISASQLHRLTQVLETTPATFLRMPLASEED